MNDRIGRLTGADVTPTTAEALWTATERLRALEEAAPVGIVALDRLGHVTIWNRAAEQLFGWRAAEVIGRPWPLLPEHPHSANTTLAGRVLQGDVVSGIEASLIGKDGSPISICQCCGPILDTEGKVSGTMWVLTDHREAKRLAQQALQAQKMEAFGQLAGGIAHDFNNLLTVIMGFGQLVMDRVRDQPELVADVAEIAHAAERAGELTSQLLGFSRKQLSVRRVLDFNEVIGAFKRMLIRVIREDIRLTIVAAPAVSHVRADPGQVEQLVMNLVVNARDAMPHGGELTIVTANVVLDSAFALQHIGAVAGEYVSLAVHDTGNGMTPEVLARVFEPFFTTKSIGKGTGLGLSTAFALVDQSGGFITVDSTLGVGTAVTTYWPAVDGFVEYAAAAPPAVASLEGTETILLVEDETGVRRLMAKVLERLGYTVLPARDADDALAIESRYPGEIHLLVSDMVMPGLSGADLAQRLVSRRPGMRALLVSGHAGREPIELSMRSHHASFLHKPFKPEALATKVRESLDVAKDTVMSAITTPEFGKP